MFILFSNILDSPFYLMTPCSYSAGDMRKIFLLFYFDGQSQSKKLITSPHSSFIVGLGQIIHYGTCIKYNAHRCSEKSCKITVWDPIDSQNLFAYWYLWRKCVSLKNCVSIQTNQRISERCLYVFIWFLRNCKPKRRLKSLRIGKIFSKKSPNLENGRMDVWDSKKNIYYLTWWTQQQLLTHYLLFMCWQKHFLWIRHLLWECLFSWNFCHSHGLCRQLFIC